MSDRLPGPSAPTGGAPTPGSVPAGVPSPRRTFRRQGTYQKPGISEADALQRLAQRRATSPAGAPPAPTVAPAPAPPPPPGQEPRGGGAFSPLAQLVGEPPARPIIVPQPAPAPAPPAEYHPLAQQPPMGPQDPVFDLTIGGEPTRVALSELIRGYMRERDYTAKTQALGAAQRQASEQFEGFKKAREALEGRLPSILAQFGNEFDQPIDWIKLAQTDPIGYAAKDARHKAYLAAKQEAQNLQQLKDNETRIAKERMREMGMQFLAQTLPGWADATTRREIQTAQMQYLRDVGFTQAEVDATELLDPRHVVILEEARRFRQIVAAYPDLLRVSTQPVPPARFGAPTFGGNGQFTRFSGAETAVGDAQQRWDQLENRTGRGARETAIALIAARRQARDAHLPPPVMASPRRRL